MNGKCDTCGKPKTADCDATGCEHQMCDEHTTRRMATSIGALPSSDIPAGQVQKFCPEHANLARR